MTCANIGNPNSFSSENKNKFIYCWRGRPQSPQIGTDWIMQLSCPLLEMSSLKHSPMSGRSVIHGHIRQPQAAETSQFGTWLLIWPKSTHDAATPPVRHLDKVQCIAAACAVGWSFFHGGGLTSVTFNQLEHSVHTAHQRRQPRDAIMARAARCGRTHIWTKAAFQPILF